MMNVLVIAALALPVPQDETKQETPPAAKPSKDTAALVALCDGLAKLPSLAFEVKRAEQGGFRGDQESTIKGKYSKGFPVLLQEGDEVVYRDGDTVIHQVADDAWEAFDFESAFGGGGGGGGDRELVMAMIGYQTCIVPHWSFKGFGGQVSDVTRAEKDGKQVFSGKLSEKGADVYSGAKLFRTFMERFGMGDVEMERSGSFTLTSSAEGVVEGLTFEASMSFDAQGQPMKIDRQYSIALSGHGKTELKVPEEVLACLEL